MISELSVTYQWVALILRGAMDVSHRSVMFYLIPPLTHSHIHFFGKLCLVPQTTSWLISLGYPHKSTRLIGQIWVICWAPYAFEANTLGSGCFTISPLTVAQDTCAPTLSSYGLQIGSIIRQPAFNCGDMDRPMPGQSQVSNNTLIFLLFLFLSCYIAGVRCTCCSQSPAPVDAGLAVRPDPIHRPTMFTR